METSPRIQEGKNNMVGIEIQSLQPVKEPRYIPVKKKVKTDCAQECGECVGKCCPPFIALCLAIVGITAILFHHAMPIAIMAIHFGPGVVSSGDVAGGALGIYRNLDVAPISDIIFSPYCPSGYEMLNLGTWPGTKSFCYEFGFIDTSYNASRCRNEYQSIFSKQYTSWKGSSICVKRIEEVSNSSTCPSGYVKCYTGVCTKGTDCGITEIHFESSARTDSGWFSIQYNSNIYVNYRKDVGAIPISTFAIVHGQPTSCLNPYEYGVQNNYDAIESRANGCGRYGDLSDAIQVDNDLSTSIFYSQPWGALPMNLPKFEEQVGRNDQKGYLMAIPRLDINNLSPCLTFNLQTFVDGAESLHSSRKVTTGFSITIIALLGIAIFFSIIFGLNYGAPGVLLIVLAYMLLIAILPAAVTASMNSDIATFQDKLSSVMNSKCFADTNPQQVFTDFVDTAAIATRVVPLWRWYTIGCWISLVVMMIAGICFAKARD